MIHQNHDGSAPHEVEGIPCRRLCRHAWHSHRRHSGCFSMPTLAEEGIQSQHRLTQCGAQVLRNWPHGCWRTEVSRCSPCSGLLIILALQRLPEGLLLLGCANAQHLRKFPCSDPRNLATTMPIEYRKQRLGCKGRWQLQFHADGILHRWPPALHLRGRPFQKFVSTSSALFLPVRASIAVRQQKLCDLAYGKQHGERHDSFSSCVMKEVLACYTWDLLNHQDG
mmetsp:Transcript_60062/g.127218  ORF Transcript_60062/g.127218 Transcript_60062/m.127218 type:complete len:224 (+) Transcript_60062:746-1417(+)